GRTAASQVRLEHPSQLLLGAMELGLYSPERQAERFGELFVLYALEIVRRDEQTIIGREPRDRLLESIAQLEVEELPILRCGHRSLTRPVVVERNGGPCASMILHTPVRDDAVAPRGKARLSPEVWQAAVDAQEYV